MPGKGRVSSARAEAPVPGTHHLLPAAPSSPGTEPNSRLSARNGAPSDHSRGNLCVVGPAGVGKVAAERIVEEPALEKSGVDCEGFMASIAHNVLKAVRRLGSGTGPPEPSGSGGYAQCRQAVSSGDRCPVAPSLHGRRLKSHPRPSPFHHQKPTFSTSRVKWTTWADDC